MRCVGQQSDVPLDGALPTMILQTYTAALNNSTVEDQEPASEGASSLLSRDRTSSSSDVAMADEDASAPLLRSSTQGRRFPE